MRRLAAIGLVLFLAGCGGVKTFPIQGKVVYENDQAAKDLAGYAITMEPDKPAEDGKIHSATGLISPEGTFTVSTFAQGDGAIGGRHKVAITAPIQSGDVVVKSKIPERYSDLNKSGLSIQVESGKGEVKLSVSKK